MEDWWDLFIQSRKFMTLKFTAEFFGMKMKNYTKFEQKLTCQLKIDMRRMTRISWIFNWAFKILKNLHFDMSFLVMFDLKKSSGVIFHDTKEQCKSWGKTNFCFQKWHEEIEKVSPEHLKISKSGLWWNSFVQS